MVATSFLGDKPVLGEGAVIVRFGEPSQACTVIKVNPSGKQAFIKVDGTEDVFQVRLRKTGKWRITDKESDLKESRVIFGRRTVGDAS